METFKQKRVKIEAYLNKTKQMATKFQQLTIKHILREENYKVDILARLATTVGAKIPKYVLVEFKFSLNIEEEIIVMSIDNKGSWMDPII